LEKELAGLKEKYEAEQISASFFSVCHKNSGGEK
jgi:hypothetical protein